MLRATFLTLSLLLTTATFAVANPHTLVKEGNKQVLEQNLDAALEKYVRAQAELDTLRPELLYNLGGVYARKGEVGRADTLYRSLAPYGGDDRLLARGDYNRGTALAQGQQFDQAVPALIEALKRDPSDQDAKINLELALRRQQQQQEQQQNQDQNQDKNQDQDKQDQQNQQDEQEQEQNQDQQDEQQQDQQQQDQQQQNQDQQDQQDQQQQQQQPQDLNKEMAERLLDQMQQDEKEQLKQVIRQQVPVKQKGTKKPW